jgi:predicted RNase H-like HicB family nuclease
MEYRAVIKKSGSWWVGWLVDLPGVNAQERTKAKLIESLKIGAEDMINCPVDLNEQEELLQIGI